MSRPATVTATPDMETHLLMPPNGVFVCCGRAPFELPRTDRMTEDANQVTCLGRLATAPYAPEAGR